MLALGGLAVIYIRHAVNLGQGAALQTGFDYAKTTAFSTIVTFDADGQHDVNDLDNLLLPLERDEADIVFGSRFLQGEKGDVSFLKKTVLTFARGINFLFSGVMLSDAHNGLRAMNRTALENIRIEENGMAHASEILFEASTKGLRLKEVPVHIFYTDYSKQKGQSSWNSIKILVDLVLYKLFK
jgi:glycosyltransferase involved in cell wall biosynthesis